MRQRSRYVLFLMVIVALIAPGCRRSEGPGLREEPVQASSDDSTSPDSGERTKIEMH
jgi:hypothetical protein